jgi:hypothetical protein
MKISYLFLILFTTGTCFSQGIEWQNTVSWKLYDIHDNKAFRYSADTFQSFKSIALDKDKMQAFLHNVTVIPKEEQPVWMGFYIATCNLKDGSKEVIYISVYGGFFYDDKTKSYYQLPSNIKDDWFNYLTDQGSILQSLKQ